MNDELRKRAGSRWLGAAVFAVVLTLAAMVGVAAYAIAGAQAEEPAAADEPLRVPVLEAERQSGFDVERGFTGRVTARRRSDVGFELAGKLISIAYDDGETVDAGAVLAELDTQRLRARRAEAVAARDEAAANAELAKDTYERVLRVRRQNAATEQELDDAENRLEAASAALARRQRAVESIDVDLGKSRLLAPFDAVVARRMADEGQVLDAGQPVLRLLERTTPEARIGIPPGAAASLTRGEPLTVTVNGETLDASVRELLPVTERDTRTVELVLQLEAELNGLRDGDLARVNLTRRIDAEGFCLPLAALTESTRGLWACLVAEPVEGDTDAFQAAYRQLEIRHSTDARAYVTGALAPGERVIANGLHRLVAGDLVQPAPNP